MINTLVIIPNYNKLDLLKKCLYHLDNQTDKNFSVFIVDNGSDEETVRYIKEVCDENKNYYNSCLDKNTGFAFASNVGLKYAIENNYEYSILLNNDCFVDVDSIKNLKNKIDIDKNYFAVNPLMISYKDNSLIDDFGDSYNLLGFQFQNKTAHKVSSVNKDEMVFSACGGASIYRNEILKKIGLLDEQFFCYLEDIDLSYRANLYGYKIITSYKAKAYHVGSATSGSKYNDFKVKISARNNIYLIYKNMPFVQIVINFLPLLCGFLIKQLYFIKKGFGKSYFNGIKEGFSTLKLVKTINFKEIPIINYFKIELKLFTNIFRYVIEYIERKCFVK